jgi:hypothetical protein
MLARRVLWGVAALLIVGGTASAASPTVIINEVMSNPDSNAAQPYGFHDDVTGLFIVSDWVEFYNPGDVDVDLKGMYLSDRCDFPTTWEIGKNLDGVEVEHLYVPAQGFLVLWCAGQDHRGTYNCGTTQQPVECQYPDIPPVMAPFRLSSEGGWIGLYDRDGSTLVSGFAIPAQPFEVTYGCYPDGNETSRGYLSTPTMGTHSDMLPSGAPNTAVINLAPLIEVRSYRGIKESEGCTEYTIVIEPGQQIRVLARIQDLDALDPSDPQLQETVLRWKLTSEGIDKTIGMTLVAGDPAGITYEAEIPGQAEGAVVAFYVSAKDAQGAEGFGYADRATDDWFKFPVGNRGAPAASSNLVINEVLASNRGCPDFDELEVVDPVEPSCQTGGRDTGQSSLRQQSDDWVELYNKGASALDLADLYLTSNELRPLEFPLIRAQGHQLNVTPAGTLPAGTPLLIWCDAETFQDDTVGVHAPFGLDGGEDEILLIAYRDADGNGDPEVFAILDVIAWGGAEATRGGVVRHCLGSQDGDWSLGRYPDGTGAWGRMEPSPGALPYFPGGLNAKLVPFVRLVAYDPVNPKPGDPITFTVRAWDEQPLPAGGVTLEYQSPFADPPVPSQTITLHDDGQGSDVTAGDGIYAGVVNEPALSGKVVYKVRATDADGNAVTSPFQQVFSGLLLVADSAPDHLVITEVLASNRACVCGAPPETIGCELGGLDNAGDADDMVEIYNPTGVTAKLNEYYLTNRLNWVSRWQFPVGAELAAGARIVVYCDNEPKEQEQIGPTSYHYHASFTLDAAGGEIALVRNVGGGAGIAYQVVDYLRFGPQANDVSYGRDPVSGEIGLLMSPALGAENASLAANAEWITEMGSASAPTPLVPGQTITVTGHGLDKAERIFVVNPLCEMCPWRKVNEWDWKHAAEIPPGQWSILNASAMQVSLPGDLAIGTHLLCVVSGFSDTWYEGGVPWTGIEFTAAAISGIFVRGDANVDGSVDIADVISVLSYLFADGKEPSCLDAADGSDDEVINIADPIKILSFLFGAGGDLPAPSEACGPDPTGPSGGEPDLQHCLYDTQKCPSGR